MATTNLTIRMDDELKKQFDSLCNEIGLSMGSAITIFAKTVVREKRIPFELAIARPNLDTLEAMLEAEKLSRKPDSRRYNNFREVLAEVAADED